MISEDGRKSNVELEWQNQNSRQSQDLHTTTKKQMIKSLVWSVALYAVEVNEKSRHTKIRGILWCWRKMLKISNTELVTNDEVLSRAKEKRSIIARITKQLILNLTLTNHSIFHKSLF